MSETTAPTMGRPLVGETLLVLLGRRIRRRRHALGWSRQRLGTESGTSLNTVLRAENAVGDVFVGSAAAIAAALRVPLADLVADAVCQTCDGVPEPGFTCNTCSRRTTSA